MAAACNHTDYALTTDRLAGFVPAFPGGALAWAGFIATAEQLIAAGRPLAEAITFFRVPALEAAVNGLAPSVGQDPATFRYLVCLLAGYPLSLLFALLPTGAVRHLFSLVAGVFMAQFVFGAEWVLLLISAAVTYVLLMVTRGKVRPYAVWVWAMGFLTCQHLYRLHTDYLGWSLDITGPAMLLTIKLTSLAWQMFDGSKRHVEKYTADLADATADESKKRLARERLALGIRALPNPLAFLGFVFSFVSLLAGPAFDYTEYMAGVTESRLKAASELGAKDDDGAKAQGAATRKYWGPRLAAAGIKFLQSLVCMAVTATAGPMFGVSFDSVFSNPAILYGTSLAYRAGWAWLCLLVTRQKYYFAWLLTEGAANVAGFGFVPPTKAGERVTTAHWGGVQNIDVWGFEAAQGVSRATLAWNKNTQVWLSRYVMKRVPRSIGKVATYTMSAFWHGFYPGYYLAFLSAPLATAVEDAIKAKITPRIPASLATLYDAVGRVFASLALNYCIMAFVSLGWDRSMIAWASVYYIGHAAFVAVLVLLALVPNVRTEGGRHGKKHAAAAPAPEQAPAAAAASGDKKSN